MEGWVDGWILIYILPASGRGFAFAKQGNKMRRLRRRTREGTEGLQKICIITMAGRGEHMPMKLMK